jgi:hypothetical protein
MPPDTCACITARWRPVWPALGFPLDTAGRLQLATALVLTHLRDTGGSS